MNWTNLCKTFLTRVVGKGCLLFSFFIFILYCIFDRKGVNIFTVFSFFIYVVV